MTKSTDTKTNEKKETKNMTEQTEKKVDTTMKPINHNPMSANPPLGDKKIDPLTEDKKSETKEEKKISTVSDFTRTMTESEITVVIIDTSDLTNIKTSEAKVSIAGKVKPDKAKALISKMDDYKAKTFEVKTIEYYTTKYTMPIETFMSQATKGEREKLNPEVTKDEKQS